MNIYIINWFNKGNLVMTDRECFKDYKAADLHRLLCSDERLSDNGADSYDIVETYLNN